MRLYMGLHAVSTSVVAAFGILMIAFAVHALSLALRRRQDRAVRPLSIYAALRLGIGLSGLWLALGGGALAGWTMVGFIVIHLMWRVALQRRTSLM